MKIKNSFRLSVYCFFIYFFLIIEIYSGVSTDQLLISIETEKQKNSKIYLIEKYNKYNDIYKILSSDYHFFIKQLYYMDNDFLEGLLDSQFNKEKEGKISKKKHPYQLQRILKILEKILILMKERTLINTKNLEYFLDLVNQEISLHKSIIYAFRKALYFATNNQARFEEITHDKNIESFFYSVSLADHALIIPMWVLYSYERFSQIIFNSEDLPDTPINNDELFFYSYPSYIESIKNTYEQINLNQTLSKFFLPSLMTNEGKKYLYFNEIYNKAINEDMAYHIINQKTMLMKLLLEEKNALLYKKITTCMKKIAVCSGKLEDLKKGKSNDTNWLFKLFNIEDLPIEYYLSEYIPREFFGLGGRNANKTSYHLNSLITFYDSAFGVTLHKIWNFSDLEKNPTSKTNGIYNNFFNNRLSSAFLPVAALWPFSNSYNEKALDNYFQIQSFRSDGQKTVDDLYWENKLIYTFKDRMDQYKHIPGTTGELLRAIPLIGSFIGPTIGLFTHLGMSYYALRNQIHSIKALISQYKSTKNHLSYFYYLKKMILYSKQLMQILLELYKSNNIAEENIIPEILQIKDIFINQGDNSQLNKMLKTNKKKIHLWLETIYNFFVPGSMAYIYFRELQENEEIDILKNYIGAIDIVLAKLNLLNLSKENSKTVFSIPILLDPQLHHEAHIEAVNMWLPSLTRGNPIKNSLELMKDHRNMMLVSPVAGGKTVLLSTILTLLYLGNIGIVPAEKFTYTYFTHILNHMKHPYEVGSGISQHLAERKSMHIVKNIAADKNTSGKIIIIIDEIYKGTRPDLAVREAYIDLPMILTKKNTMTLVTTHFPEITNIVKNKELSIDLYYLLVEYIGGFFRITHKLFKDDESNWWIRDPDLGLKYQLSQDAV